METKTKQWLEQYALFDQIKVQYNLPSWKINKVFAIAFSPLINKYIKNVDKIVVSSYAEMGFIEKSWYRLTTYLNLSNPINTFIINKAQKKLLLKLNNFKDVLLDISEEGSEDWERSWMFKELLPVKYIYEKSHEKNTGPLVKIQVHPDYTLNSLKNKQRIQYNVECFVECVKWRKKHIAWFMKHFCLW